MTKKYEYSHFLWSFKSKKKTGRFCEICVAFLEYVNFTDVKNDQTTQKSSPSTLSIMSTSIILSNIQLLIVIIYVFLQDFFFFWLKPKQYKNANIADWLNKKNIHKIKQINCQIIWRETVRKLIDGLKRLG